MKTMPMGKHAITKEHGENVLFADGSWTMTDAVANNQLNDNSMNGSRLWHRCEPMRERYQSPYDTLKGKCWACEKPVPDDIKTVWMLYNADKLHMWCGEPVGWTANKHQDFIKNGH